MSAPQPAPVTASAEAARPASAQRRRACIVFADLVESDRLMRRDEAAAIDRWRRFAAMARERWLPACGLTRLRLGGDALLMEFANAPAGLRAAFALHAGIESVNAGCAAEDLMRLRIGIHCAEVLADEFETYGVGVNLAARLAALAAPGQTLLSAVARDELVDGLHAQLEDLGERYVKHLDEPLRVFGAQPPGEAGAAAAQRPLPRTGELRPAVAVVPFAALPPDPEHDALGHAMADDIIATLARHGGLRVLSRASTAALRDLVLDPPTLARTLGADYLVSGRFYAHAGRVRLHVELCELRSAEVLWTGSAQADVASLFAGQDDLVPEVVGNISQCVLARELTRVRSLPLDTLASYTLFLGATGLMNSLVREDFQRAHGVLEHLAERHPRQAAPRAVLARWHVFHTVQGWAADRARETLAASEHARRAMDIDPGNPLALTTHGLAQMDFHDDPEGAQHSFRRALAGAPQDALSWVYLAAAHALLDEHDEACAAADQALALSPLDPNRFLLESYAALARFGAGRYEQAAEVARSSLRHHLLHAPSHRLHIAALWCAGRHDEARTATARFLQAYPDARVGKIWRKTGPRRASWAALANEALRAAGLPP